MKRKEVVKPELFSHKVANNRIKKTNIPRHEQEQAQQKPVQ
jgi:hypothetical protein